MLRTGCFILFLMIASAHGAVPSVKVLIAKSLNHVQVEGMDLKKTIHTQKISQQYSGKKLISTKKSEEAIDVDKASPVKAFKGYKRK